MFKDKLGKSEFVAKTQFLIIINYLSINYANTKDAFQ